MLKKGDIGYCTPVKKKLKYKQLSDSTSDIIMELEGYASTRTVDRMGEIVDPKAFESSIEEYMEFPVLHLNHDFGGFSSGAPYGKVVDYRIDSYGLWVKVQLIDTPRGREVKALVEAGILRAFSIGFRVKAMEVSYEEDVPPVITDLQLIEISLVSSPANVDALIEAAEAKGLTLKAFSPEGIGKGVNVMSDLKKLKEFKELEDSLSSQGETVEEVKTTVSEVKGEHSKLSKKVVELQEAIKNIQDTSVDKTDEFNRIETLTKNVSAEVLALQTKLEDAIREAKSRKPVSGSGMGVVITDIKSVVKMSPNEIRYRFPVQDAERIQKFQRLHDDVILADAMLDAASRNAKGKNTYHLQDRTTRIKSLPIYSQFSEYYKAMDTATASQGGDWIPTEFSGELIRDVELQQVVAPQFRQIRQSSNPFKVRVFSGPTIAERAPEVTTVVSGFNTREQDFTTTVMTFDAEKTRGRHQISAEQLEDVLINELPIARENLVQSHARAHDICIINGDTDGAHFDTTPSIDETYDAQTMYDGLRKAVYVTIGATAGSIDMSTPSEDNWNSIRALMGKYAFPVSSLVNFVSLNVMLKHLLKPSEFPSFVTIDKYGPLATVQTGEFAKAFGVPVLASEYMPDTCGVAGIRDSNGSTVKGSSLIVNRNMWLRSLWRDIEVYVEKDNSNDVWQLYSYMRGDFQPVITPSSTVVTVAGGHNW